MNIHFNTCDCKEHRNYHRIGGSFGDNHDQRKQQDEWITWYETVWGEDFRTDCYSADWPWDEKKQFHYFARLNGEVHSTSHTELPPVASPLFYTLSLLTVETLFPKTTLGLIQSTQWNISRWGSNRFLHRTDAQHTTTARRLIYDTIRPQ